MYLVHFILSFIKKN